MTPSPTPPDDNPDRPARAINCCVYSSVVLETRPVYQHALIRRRRQCEECGKRFTTYECLSDSLAQAGLQQDSQRLVTVNRHLAEIARRANAISDLLLPPESSP